MGINSYTYITVTPSSDVISLTSKENLEVCLQQRNVIRRSLTTYRRPCDLQGVITNHYHPLDNLTKAWIKWRNATELKEKHRTVHENKKNIIRQSAYMMTSSNGIIFRVTDPLWGKSTGDRSTPLTKASDAELWCFLWSASEQTIDTPAIWDAITTIMTSL